MAERNPVSVQDVSSMLARQIKGSSGEQREGLEGLAKQFQAAEELGWFTPVTETVLEVPTSKLTPATFHDYLLADLKHRGQEIALPKPSAEIVEVHNILAGKGYEVVPIAFVDRNKKNVRIGVFETVARPDYTNGSQMYYSPRPDPLAGILRIGRTESPQRIKYPYGNASEETRFYVSWNEIHDFVVPETIETTPHLADQLTKGGIVFNIPNLADFRYAGQRYNLEAYSWEWVQDAARFGHRCIVGYRVRGVDGWLPDSHGVRIGFRFEAVSGPQPLPR